MRRRPSDIVHVDARDLNEQEHIKNGNIQGHTMKGLNANGLKTENGLEKLLNEAKRADVAILFVQEHDFTKDEEAMLRRTARSRLLCLCRIEACGTAIFLHLSSC